MTRSEEARSNMIESRMNCAQSVLTAFCDSLGLDRATALKLSRGFGAGMGRGGKTCGAVTGAYMVIGLSEPKSSREGTQAVYGRVQEFNSAFIEKYGSTECSRLIGCDISTAQGMNRARSEGLFIKHCPDFVKGAVEILDQIR
ncbi:MAG: C-GCAxxG-C-C family protein [Dehalogenimonas sp.]